jgi:hypothetical protein
LPNKAFIDTTVLTDALLKGEPYRSVARSAIAGFAHSQLPMYAIKEFKAGPLRNYVWFHNKVVQTRSWEDAVRAIPSVRMQANKMMTALQALAEFSGSLSKRLPSDFAARYPGESFGEIQKREAATWLKMKILRAWRGRRQLTTEVVETLSCYTECDPRVNKLGLVAAILEVGTFLRFTGCLRLL